MVDTRPDSSSYARAGYLRSLHGDHAGAVEMYKLAARTADPADKESQAWCLSQLGNEFWRDGEYQESISVFEEALSILPNYHHAVFGKARSFASSGKTAEAIPLLEELQKKVPAMETVLLLGDLYLKAGNSAAAKLQYAMAENGEEELRGHYDEHRMALFRADHDKDLDRALDVAIADHAEIKDIYASDILAWCLYKKGRFNEARTAILEAMRIKTRDARIYYHAGMIELSLGNKAAARKHLSTALEINPNFHVLDSDKARAALNSL